MIQHAASNPRTVIVSGFVVLGLMLVGTLAWGAMGKLDSATHVAGNVTVESSRRAVQHLEGGIVRAIEVREGDYVEKGDVLIRLDGTGARAQLGILQSQVDYGLAKEARLLAERAGRPAVLYPPELTMRADRPEVRAIMAGEESVFRTRRTFLDGEIAIRRTRIEQLRRQIEGLEEFERAKRRQLSLIEEELAAHAALLAEGYTTRSRVVSLEREAERLRGERGERLAAIARARQEIGGTELAILQLTKTFREDVNNQLKDVQSRNFELMERLIDARDTVERTDIRAPVSGRIVDMAVHTIGGVIPPGKPIVDMVPDEEELVIEGQLPPQHIDAARVGQKIAVQLGTTEARRLPVLEGTISRVSADKLTDEDERREYYLFRVVIEREAVRQLGDFRVYTGMPADIMLRTGQRTVVEMARKHVGDVLARAFRN